ncbi:MAG: SMC-Scp complex subunit ScpB [Propionibacteriales bacterium]|nr:SMC-Scp complex subunit ScpB [Propionibacteriales bacterium]
MTGAIVFRTTDEFLERMGLHSLKDLPPLAPHLPEVSELEAELGQLAVVAEPQEANDPAGTPADDEGAYAPERNDQA